MTYNTVLQTTIDNISYQLRELLTDIDTAIEDHSDNDAYKDAAHYLQIAIERLDKANK